MNEDDLKSFNNEFSKISKGRSTGKALPNSSSRTSALPDNSTKNKKR